MTLTDKITEKRAEIERLEMELKVSRAEYANLMVEEYKLRNGISEGTKIRYAGKEGVITRIVYKYGRLVRPYVKLNKKDGSLGVLEREVYTTFEIIEQ